MLATFPQIQTVTYRTVLDQMVLASDNTMGQFIVSMLSSADLSSVMPLSKVLAALKKEACQTVKAYNEGSFSKEMITLYTETEISQVRDAVGELLRDTKPSTQALAMLLDCWKVRLRSG